MLIKLRNVALAALLFGAIIGGFAGPIMYPEMMVNANYMPGI